MARKAGSDRSGRCGRRRRTGRRSGDGEGEGERGKEQVARGTAEIGGVHEQEEASLRHLVQEYNDSDKEYA